MPLCGHKVAHGEGAEPCPREPGHPGDCYFWIPIERAYGITVLVYVFYGEFNEHRKTLCKGEFESWPNGYDVQRLVRVIVQLRRREKAEAAAARANPQPVVPDFSGEAVAGGKGAKNNTRLITPPSESKAARSARALARSVQR